MKRKQLGSHALAATTQQDPSLQFGNIINQTNHFRQKEFIQNPTFQKNSMPLIMKSLNGQKQSPQKNESPESHKKQAKVQFQGNIAFQMAPESQRTKKEISVNLIDQIINQDDNQVRTNDARRSHNTSGLRQDSMIIENPMKQRYHVQPSSRSPRKSQFTSDDSIEKLNDIMNLSEELNRIHHLKIKRDQMIIQNQILIDGKTKDRANHQSHKWQDTAQILEQLTVSQYSLGRSDAKQQRELQMKLMQNHFTKQDQIKQSMVQRGTQKSGFGALTRNNQLLNNQQRHKSVQRTPGQLEYLHDRRSSLMTNGVNIPQNQLHPGTAAHPSKRSKTPLVEGGVSPRKYQSRMFPPPIKANQIKNHQGGLNFSFRQSLDFKDLNQDLKSEAINLDHFSKQHPRSQSKERQQGYTKQRTQILQFARNSGNIAMGRQSNMNCGTSPMSPHTGQIPGFHQSVSGSNEIKVLEENHDYQMNPNNIYNQLGSKLQSDRSHQAHTKVIQSQNSTIGSPKTKLGEIITKLPQNHNGKISSNQQGTLLQQSSHEGGSPLLHENSNHEYQKDLKFANNQSPGNSPNPTRTTQLLLPTRQLKETAPSPVSKTHQISIQTSKCYIENQVTNGSDDAPTFKQEVKQISPATRRSFKEEDEMKTTLHENSVTSQHLQDPPQLSDENRQKLLNILEVTSKTLSNSQSVEGRMNKFIQTRVEERDETSTQTRNSKRVPNFNVTNQNHITFQDQNPSPQQKAEGKSKEKKLFPIQYNFKDYEQEIQKLTGMKRKPMRPIEKRMIATQVFAIQAYDSFSGGNSQRESKILSQMGGNRSKIQSKQTSQKLATELEKHVDQLQTKLKITLPISGHGQNLPTSPADSGIEHNHQISDYGPRLVSSSPTPSHKRCFYEQLQQAYKQKTGKQYKVKGGTGVGIHQKIQKLSRKREVDKIDAWAAAEILSEFPELAQELLSAQIDGNVVLDETLNGVIIGLKRKKAKSPINSGLREKELNQAKLTSPEREQEKGTMNTDRQKEVSGANNIRKNALRVGRRSSSVRMTPAESPKNSRGGETREENEFSTEAQEELRKITFQIESDDKQDTEKMVKQLEVLFPNRQISQMDEKDLRQLMAKLLVTRPGIQTPDVRSGRRANTTKLLSNDGTFFNPRRQNQGILKNSTFLPLKDRQAKQQFRIFVQNEKSRVERKTIFEPIKQKQPAMDRQEASQELPNVRDPIKRESMALESSAPGFTQESGFWSALSHIGPMHPAPIYQKAPSRLVHQLKDQGQKSQSPGQFPPKRGAKSSHRHQRNISQLQHHRNQLQNIGYQQNSPKDGVLKSNGALLNGKEVQYHRPETQPSNENRSAKVAAASNADDNSQGNVLTQSSRLTNQIQQANILLDSQAASRPSTLMGFLDQRVVPGSVAVNSIMKVSQQQVSQHKLEERRGSVESQGHPVSIPKQRKVEDMELLGTKQMLTKRVNLNSNQTGRGESPQTAVLHGSDPVTLETAVQPINIQVGSTQIEIRAPSIVGQTSGNTSLLAKSAQPASLQGVDPSNTADSRNVSQLIQHQVSTRRKEGSAQANALSSPHSQEEAKQFAQQTGRTRETERREINNSQMTIKLDSEQNESVVFMSNSQNQDAKGAESAAASTFQVEKNRIITSKIHEKVDTSRVLGQYLSQDREQEASCKDMVSDLKSNGEAATSDILSPMQQIQKVSRPSQFIHSPAEPYLETKVVSALVGNNINRLLQVDEGFTTAENPTVENVKTLKSVAAIKFVEDNLIMILDSPRGNKDEGNLQETSTLLEFLDQKFQPAPLTSTQELYVAAPQHRYKGVPDNLSNSVIQIQSIPSTSFAATSPKFIDRTNTAKLQDSYDPTSFQAGSYIKNLKRSVEKPDKCSKDSQKQGIEMFVSSVHDSFQKPSLPVPQIQSKSVPRNTTFPPNKKSPSPRQQQRIISVIQPSETSSLARNQMAVQNIANNMRLQKQQQFQKQLPNLPMVIGTNFCQQTPNKNQSLQLQQANNANFSVINPQAQISQMQVLSYQYMKNGAQPGVDILEAINEMDPNMQNSAYNGDPAAVNYHQVKIGKSSMILPKASGDTLLDQIIAQAAHETEKSPGVAVITSRFSTDLAVGGTPTKNVRGSAISSIESASHTQTPEHLSRLPKDVNQTPHSELLEPIRIENQNK